MNAELLPDIDPSLEMVFSRFTAPEQSILESLPWDEQPPASGCLRTFVAKVHPDHMFWRLLWRPDKARWKQRRFAVSKPDEDWRLTFTFLDPDRKAEAIAQSGVVIHDGIIPAPPGLDYFEFQKAGVQFLDTHPSAILADDMGLGKTIQICGLLNLRPEIRSVLIVCPASVKFVWARELSRWLVDKSRTVSVANRVLDESADVVIVNYDLLRKFGPQLSRRRYDLLVLDEAHYIKTPSAQRTKAVKALATLTDRKVLLTGTPIMNRPAELWSLLNLLDAKAWGPFFQFAQSYCDAKKGPFGWDFSGASNLEGLSDRLRSSGTMLRRRKADVLPQLPRLIRQIVPLAVDMSPVLETLTEAAAEKLGLAPDNLPFDIDPTRIPFELVSAIRHETGVLKIDAAIRFIKDETADSDDKIVLFAHHTEVLGRLHEAFPESVLVTGATPLPQRQKAIDSFQSGSTKYFIASTLAMGVGVTLTASSRVIFVEPDWTPAMLEQAESRLHRIGQTGSVLCQYLVVHDSIDERIMAAVHAKMMVIDAVLPDLKPTQTSGDKAVPPNSGTAEAHVSEGA